MANLNKLCCVALSSSLSGSSSSGSTLHALCLPAGKRVSLRGGMQLRPVRGSVAVDGAVLRPRAHHWWPCVRPVYGPPLTLQAAPAESHADEPISNYAGLEPGIAAHLDQHFPKYPCIVLLRADAAYAAAFAQTDPTLAALLPLEDDVDTGESAAGETPTPAKRARFKGILELPTGVWAVEDHTLYPESWRSFCTHFVERVRINRKGRATVVLCGPKDVGKSTLMRFCINSLLSAEKLCSGVALLDCDPGQAELNPPGCVALHFVREPLLSTAFATQLHTPQLMIHLGENSPRDNAEDYLAAIAQLYNHFRKQEEDMPLVINTPGWVKGLGHLLIADIVRLTRPQVVVELQSPNASRNLDPSLAQGMPAQSLLPAGQAPASLVFDTVHLGQATSAEGEADGPTSGAQITAADIRSCLLVSHLLGASLTPLTQQRVLRIPLRDVLLGCTEPGVPPEETLVAMNGTMVALCMAPKSGLSTVQVKLSNDVTLSVLTEVPPMETIGYAVVRAADVVDGGIYIISPVLASPMLPRVSALIRGNLPLPAAFYRSQPIRPGRQPPYITADFGDIQALGRSARSTRQGIERR